MNESPYKQKWDNLKPDMEAFKVKGPSVNDIHDEKMQAFLRFIGNMMPAAGSAIGGGIGAAVGGPEGFKMGSGIGSAAGTGLGAGFDYAGANMTGKRDDEESRKNMNLQAVLSMLRSR